MTQQTTQESIDFINDYRAKFNFKPLSNKELADFLIGGETDQELEEIARETIDNDYEAIQENKNAWRYEV